ncbi:MAG: ParB/RepB/Spo0J family partition protein [Candidatus Bathyarchaeia archaeon]
MSELVKEIELKKIRPNRLNPRLDINVEHLNELADSIKEVGLLEPIIVRPVNNEFEVVVGERRYRASQQAGLEKVPAIVREYSDDEVVQLNLIENVQREDLSAIEKGKVCKFLLEKYPDKYPSQMALAKKIGVSHDTISLWLRTIEVVPQEVQKYVAPSTISREVPEGKIDYLTAVKVGRSVKEPKRRVEVIKKLAERRLPVRERSQVIEKVSREPERPIEEVIEEVAETPYELPFRLAHMKPIIDGIKTQTSRTGIPDPKVKVGAIVHAAIWEPHFADLRITSIERKRLKYFDEEDAKREGGYTLEEFKKVWKDIHGEWDENQFVYVIHFEKVK